MLARECVFVLNQQNTHTIVCAHTYTHMHAHTHTHIHTYTHVHEQTHMLPPHLQSHGLT